MKEEKKGAIKIIAALTAISTAITATVISFQIHKYLKR